MPIRNVTLSANRPSTARGGNCKGERRNAKDDIVGRERDKNRGRFGQPPQPKDEG